MRKVFSDSIEKAALLDDKIIFITGDLGFNAFENLQKLLGNRFINAVVAEQNMVGMAAGMAYKGFKVFCYSIAPFVVYRCLEQMRNDVCFHKLPVFLVGNGGGYGYGIMGSSHHALSDIACLASLPNINCWVPAYTEDVNFCISSIINDGKPAYLRLGSDVKEPENTMIEGNFKNSIHNENSKVSLVCLGPIVQNVLNVISKNNLQNKCDVFTSFKLPINKLPNNLLKSISQTKKLIVIEEHVGIGGIGQQISLEVLKNNINLYQFYSLTAMNYPNELYGNQKFHQEQSGLDENNILSIINKCI